MGEKTARIWSASSGAEIVMLGGSSGGINSAVFSRDESRTIIADAYAHIWDAIMGKEIAALNVSDHQRVSSAAPDGSRIITASWDETARVWDAATYKEIAVLRRHDAAMSSAVFSPDGKRIATGSWDKTARIWDVATVF
jgi:WD40 repeat protein